MHRWLRIYKNAHCVSTHRVLGQRMQSSHVLAESRRQEGGMCLRRSICQEMLTKGGWRGLAQRYSGTICKAGCWSQAKDSRTAGAPPWLINAGLRELHFDMNEDNSATTFCECLILPSLSGDGGQTPCPQLGIHNPPKGRSAPPAN